MSHERRLQHLEAQAQPAIVAALLHQMRQRPLDSSWGLALFYALEHQSEALGHAVVEQLTEDEWNNFCPEPMRHFLDTCTLDELEGSAEALWPKWQAWLRQYAADTE
jgi:hypothetical protein